MPLTSTTEELCAFNIVFLMFFSADQNRPVFWGDKKKKLRITNVKHLLNIIFEFPQGDTKGLNE